MCSSPPVKRSELRKNPLGLAYAGDVGMRYLRGKKRSTISMITFIAVAGVALGVAALLSVLSITTGFQEEFRNKVLGVNAHVLVMKYGRDFDEYRDVIATSEEMPEVAGAAPFLIVQMMIANGDRLASVLIKGVDPERMPNVLTLPEQIAEGSLEGLRMDDAAPPSHPLDTGGGSDDWQWLDDYVQSAEGGASEPAATEPDELEPIDTFEALPEVEVASPEAVENLLNGVEEAWDDDDWGDDDWDDAVDAEAETESAEDTESLPGIVVGRTLAESLEIEVGGRVRLISPLSGIDLSMVSSEVRAPESRDYRVIAIFEAGFQEYDSRLVYTDLYEAQRFVAHGDSVTGVEMRVHDLDTSREVARSLERNLGGGYNTMDWAELNQNLFTALKIQKMVLAFVIATIIFVAAFNVIATLIMIVLEKKREIAILKAMGARDGAVLWIFALQGTVIGLIGTLIGLLVGGIVVAALSQYGFPLDPKVYLIDHLPVVFDPLVFVLTAIIAFCICAVATIAPSLWAARMIPVDGLRQE